MHTLPKGAAVLAATWLAMGAGPAAACLTCGCGGSGTSADLGAIGGAASMFSMGHHWLVQEGTNVRDITGSFNERGEWNPAPVGGSIYSVQSSLGLTYFPSLSTSIALQIPLVANRLNNAAWGPLGSVAPTDAGMTSGAAIGDLSVQGTYKFYEADQWALAAWGGASAPTGQQLTEAGDTLHPADMAGITGAGVWSGQAGLLGITQLGDFELTGTLGYQLPFSRPSLAASTFYVGNAVLYQVQGNYRLSDDWRVGLGLNGYRGNGQFGASDTVTPMAAIKLVPSVQYSWGGDKGIRVAAGYDPLVGGMNAMTDLSGYAVFYQYLQ
jgi:hypothetical protein